MITLPTNEVVAELVSSVTKTMIGISFNTQGSKILEPDPTWCAAMLPVGGEHPVTFALSSDAQSCAKIGAQMFMCSPREIQSEMIADGMKELLNMTAGQMTRRLKLDQALGLPVIVGAQQVRPTGTEPWRVVVLQSGPVNLVVSMIPDLVLPKRI